MFVALIAAGKLSTSGAAPSTETTTHEVFAASAVACTCF